MQFSDLKGKVLVNVEVEYNTIKYITDTGDVFMSYHEQDCCERVWIEDICGDINDLLHSPLLVSEEVTERINNYEFDESTTYTFYKLDTRKGGVTIRWCGTSNGYYSKAVDFEQVNEA